MALFSSRTGTWSGRRSRVNVPLPETVRDDRQWHTEMPGGITRIDYGAPVPRLPCEPQPVCKHTPKAVLAEAPAEAPKLTPASVATDAARDRPRDHRATPRQPSPRTERP